MRAPVIAPATPAGWRRAQYRVRQFWQGVVARVSPEEHALAARMLPAAALELFERMPADAQRHSLNVLAAVTAIGVAGEGEDADLAAAALLHDVGKVAAQDAGVRLGPWLRGPLVLLEAWTPDLLRRAAREDPGSGWRYAVYVHFEHGRLGADMAQQAGCSELTCWLIAHHQDRATAGEGGEYRQRLLAALQRADDAC